MSPASPIAEVLSQGDEVVFGQIADTNAAWISNELTSLGFEVCRHTTVGDRLDALIEVLREIAGRADCCICTGGLGPTRDDLTAEAVAMAFASKLAFDPEAFRQIEAQFAGRGIPMPGINRKQAMLPDAARRLDNLWGTAPGFSLSAGRCRFFFLPGVPGEMTAMFRQWVLPELLQGFSLRPLSRVTIRTLGLGESAMQELVAPLPLPPEVRLGFRAAPPEVQLKLSFPADFDPARKSALLGQYRGALSTWTFGVEGVGEKEGDLAELVGQVLEPGRQRLCLADSTTGGQLARACGQRTWLPLAISFADDQSLYRYFRLQGPASLDDGAMEAVAAQAAVALQTVSGADCALVQLGGEGGSEGRIHTALAVASGHHAESRRLRGAGERFRLSAAAYALDFLRRQLLERG